ncbi:MAG: NTP transferase domain-containing protein [Candidatus Wildermuthbacteria bacterium]|nr:NTP transferase domain-containing protein [Candidatus Wildermuthbacteria bacterium]
MAEITKAIIPIAGRGLRFLPLSKVLPKELFPLGDKPLIHYAVAEAKGAGATEIIFVTNTAKKFVGDYFRRSPQLEKIIDERHEEKLIEELREVERLCEGLTFSYASEPQPQGDGHAILQARKLIGDEPCFVLYPDDVIVSSKPVLSQLEQLFKTSQRPILALASMAKERLSSYGVISGEKITNKVYKVKKIIEKPKIEEAPSHLVLVGRSIITPEVFEYLKKARPNKKGEVSLTETFGEMVRDGQVIYGYEIEGKWLECGTKREWLKSFFSFALSEPELRKEIQQLVKEQK